MCIRDRHQAGEQGGEEGAVTLGHGKSPDRREVNSADRQSTGHAKSGFWGAQTTGLLALLGLTGLNSQVVFRTPIAHRLKRPNPHGARLAGRCD